MKIKYFLTEVSLLLIIALLCDFFEIRVCLFYNIFKIPCPGCGVTRSVIEFFKGNIIKSIQFNILGSLIIITCSIYLFLLIIKKDDILYNFIENHKKIIIIISVILLLLIEFINLNNSRLFLNPSNL